MQVLVQVLVQVLMGGETRPSKAPRTGSCMLLRLDRKGNSQREVREEHSSCKRAP